MFTPLSSVSTRPRLLRRRPLAVLLAGALLGVTLAQPAATSAPRLAPPSPASAPAPAAYQSFTKVIGHSREKRPIKVHFRGDPSAPHQVVVLGQIHGDEKAGVEVATHMLRLRPRAGTGLWIVPTMNPDGYRRTKRQNARGVDLNRNWPVSTWSSHRSSCCWGGPKPASEPETQAMMKLLAAVKPDYIAPLHQPFGVINDVGKDRGYQWRLSKQLRLPVKAVPVTTRVKPKKGEEGVTPTLGGWYNLRHARHGTSTVIELPRRTTKHYREEVVAPGLMRATRLWEWTI